MFDFLKHKRISKYISDQRCPDKIEPPILPVNDVDYREKLKQALGDKWDEYVEREQKIMQLLSRNPFDSGIDERREDWERRQQIANESPYAMPNNTEDYFEQPKYTKIPDYIIEAFGEDR